MRGTGSGDENVLGKERLCGGRGGCGDGEGVVGMEVVVRMVRVLDSETKGRGVGHNLCINKSVQTFS